MQQVSFFVVYFDIMMIVKGCISKLTFLNCLEEADRHYDSYRLTVAHLRSPIRGERYDFELNGSMVNKKPLVSYFILQNVVEVLVLDTSLTWIKYI